MTTLLGTTPSSSRRVAVVPGRGARAAARPRGGRRGGGGRRPRRRGGSRRTCTRTTRAATCEGREGRARVVGANIHAPCPDEALLGRKLPKSSIDAARDLLDRGGCWREDRSIPTVHLAVWRARLARLAHTSARAADPPPPRGHRRVGPRARLAPIVDARPNRDPRIARARHPRASGTSANARRLKISPPARRRVVAEHHHGTRRRRADIRGRRPRPGARRTPRRRGSPRAPRPAIAPRALLLPTRPAPLPPARVVPAVTSTTEEACEACSDDSPIDGFETRPVKLASSPIPSFSRRSMTRVEKIEEPVDPLRSPSTLFARRPFRPDQTPD